MSLHEAIEDLKKEIAEKADEPEVVEEVEEAPKEEEPKVEEEPAKEEPKEEKLDDSGYARLRREAAAAKKLANDEAARREAAEAKLAAIEAPEAVEQTFDDPELEEIRQERRNKRAEREFEALEAKYRRVNPDYDAVAAEYALALAQSIKTQHPRLSNSEIIDKTKETILIKARDDYRAGFDPAEELYHDAKELGITGKKAEPKVEIVEELKPDMEKLAANRKKSAGMAAASGKSEGIMTKQAAADLTVAEWAKLPATEKRRLLSS